MVGCPGVEKVEFTIFSENVVDSPAYVWNNEGSVKLIEMEVSFVSKRLKYPMLNLKISEIFEVICP